ncbi:MAG: hypothetical protein J6A08_07290 [Lachnospiraceae bacterium]|nr:hypothetical protein [Lachnospiraceae bacterium]
MKMLMALISKTGKKLDKENVAALSLLIHTVLWFALGSGIGAVLAVVTWVSEALLFSYMVAAGSVCALVFGYICGLVYLLRQGA